MIGNKDKQILIRTTDYENRMAKYFAEECGISVAEVFRLSLKMIANDIKPSNVPQFKNLYNKEDDA